MSKEQENKAVVGRWFKEFWGNPWNPAVVDELATPDILLQYSLHAPRRGRKDVKTFMTEFRRAFPDLEFWGAVGRRRHAHGSRLQRLSHRLPSGGLGAENALHGNDRAARAGRQDRRGNRLGRWRNRAAATRHLARGLTLQGGRN